MTAPRCASGLRYHVRTVTRPVPGGSRSRYGLLRTRATTNVAIVSRNAIAFRSRFGGTLRDEGLRGTGILALARSGPAGCPRGSRGDIDEQPVRAHSPPLSVIIGRSECRGAPVDERSFARPAGDSGSVASPIAPAHMAGACSRCSMITPQLPRRTANLSTGLSSAVVFRASQPLHRAAEALELLRSRFERSRLEGVTAIRVTLELAGPGVAVEPWRAPVARVHQLTVPAVPVQRRLLRAS